MTLSFNELLDAVEAVDAAAADTLGSGRAYLEFAPIEYGLRHLKARTLMAAAGLDALVLAEPANVRYYTGLRSWFTALPPVLPILAVITHDARTSTIVDTLTEKGSVEAASWIEEAELYGAWDDPIDVLLAALGRRGLSRGRVGMELGWGRLPHISPADLERFRSSYAGEVVDASEILHAIRAIKSSAEVALLRRATELITIGFEAVCSKLTIGMTEVDMTRVAADAISAAGGVLELNPSVFIFMAGSDRYRLPLLPATQRRLGRDELISLDGGCSVQGYHSDFARAAVIGQLDEHAAHQFTATVGALEAAVSALKPGLPVAGAWTAAQSFLDARSLGEYAVNPRNIGHSIGLDHWERPTIARPDSEMGQVTARPGMILCLEPQIAGAGGDDDWSHGLFLVEDQVLVTEDGVEVLTAQMPRDLFVAGG